MKISFSKDQTGPIERHQARAEQAFSTAASHGDFCLTAYGATRDEAHANLRQLALGMVRELDRVRNS